MEMYLTIVGILILIVVGLYVLSKKDNKIYDGSVSLMPHMMEQYFPTRPDGLMAAKKVELFEDREFSKQKSTGGINTKFYQTPTQLEISNTQKTLDKKPPLTIVKASEKLSKPIFKSKIIDFPAENNFRSKEEMKANLTKEPLLPPTAE